MMLEKISISLLLMISMAGAFANPGQNREDRAARQQQRAMERSENQGGHNPNQGQYGRPNDNGGAAGRNNSQFTDDGSRTHGRMTPEERQALRRQINEAGHDIYLPKP